MEAELVVAATEPPLVKNGALVVVAGVEVAATRGPGAPVHAVGENAETARRQGLRTGWWFLLSRRLPGS